MSGRYQVVRSIAVGGMAEVFLARMTGEAGFAKTVALKRLPPAFAANEDVVRMLMDEARLAAQLNHPQVVQVFDFGRDEQGYYIAMEYVDGPDLNTVLKYYRATGMRPPEAPMISAMVQALRGLDYAHRLTDEDGLPLGVVHRDVSPSNVLVTAEGVAKVSDFGIAKAQGRFTETKVGAIKGKIPYMSPEQARGRPVDLRTDVLSAGLVLWECLVGRRCHDASADQEVLRQAAYAEHPTFAEVGMEIDPELEAIVERALRRDPLERFQSAGEMAQALESYHRRAHPQFSPSELGAVVNMVLGTARTRSGQFLVDIPAEEPQLADALLDAGTQDTMLRIKAERDAAGRPLQAKSKSALPDAKPGPDRDIPTDWGLGGVAPVPSSPSAEPPPDESAEARRASDTTARQPAAGVSWEPRSVRRPKAAPSSGATTAAKGKPGGDSALGGATAPSLPSSPPEAPGPGPAGSAPVAEGGFSALKAIGLVFLTLLIGAGVFVGISYVERPAPGEGDLDRKPPPPAPIHATAVVTANGAHSGLKTYPEADGGSAGGPDATVNGGANPSADGAVPPGPPTKAEPTPPHKGKHSKEGAVLAPGGGTGKLDLTCTPWCDVYIDGTHVARSPIAGLSLAAGTHSIRVKNPELNAEKKAQLQIQADEHVFKNFNMVLP